MRNLDLNQLRAFAAVADLRSFTAAGESLGTTQSAISLRLAKLEEQIGQRLLARTPRSVSLTPEGVRFLPHARAIITAHDLAFAEIAGEADETVVRLAVSEHAAGGCLTRALMSLRSSLPLVTPEIVTGLSTEMRDLYDRGDADAAIVRQDANRRDGTPLFSDSLIWVAGPALRWSPGQPVPLVSLRGPCGVKAVATRALDEAEVPWRKAFLGGSVVALQAAVQAGLGMGVFGTQHVPAGCSVLSVDEGLPPLPTGGVVMLSRLDGATRRALEAAFRSAGPVMITPGL